MSTYTVRITLADYTFTVTQGAVDGTLDDGPVVLDGLSIRWAYAGDVLPAQLEPMTAQLQLSSLLSDQVAGLGVNDYASVECRDSAGVVFASIYGRISELTNAQLVEPAPAGGSRVRNVFNVAVVDHTGSTMAGWTVSGVLAASDAHARFDFNLVPLMDNGNPSCVRLYVDSPQQMLAQTLDGESLVGLVRAHVGYLFNPSIGATPAQMLIVARAFDVLAWGAAMGGSRPYLDNVAQLVDVRVPTPALDGTSKLPGRLAFVAGVVTMVPIAGQPRSVDACDVTIDGEWRQDRSKIITRVRVTNSNTPPAKVTAAVPAPAPASRRPLDEVDDGVELVVETVLTNAAAMGTTLTAFTPEPLDQGRPSWDRDSFRWRVSDPTAIGANTWMPHLRLPDAGALTGDPLVVDPYGVTKLAPDCFGMPVAVWNLADNLAGTPAYAGRLTSCQLTIDAGKVALDFTVRQQLDRPVAGRTPTTDATWAWFRADATLNTKRYTEIDRALTYADSRLIRR